MIILFSLSCLLGSLLVTLAAVLRKRRLIRNETARKLVHFAHALVVAGWPIFIGYWFVIFGEIVFLAAILIAQEYKIFHHLRLIGRKSWGEFFFPLGVIGLAIIAPPTWLFALALLLLGLADGAAAIVGNRLKTKVYKIFGHKKTIAGSLAFFIVSVLLMVSVLWVAPSAVSLYRTWLAVISVSLLATVIENISPYGSDNLTVPLAVYFGLLGFGLVV